MRNKKILYLFSETGGGHRSAANALIEAIKEIMGDNAPKQELADVFASSNKLISLLANMYAPITKYCPFLWGAMFHATNSNLSIVIMAKVSAPFVGKKLQALIKEKKPDIIVSVHPMTNHIAVTAMREINHNVPIITVVTDPVTFHRVWISPLVDRIVLATEDAKTLCGRYGYSIDNIEVLGFPIEPKFFKTSASKKELRKSMGIDSGKFTLLFMGGGEGGGNIYEYISTLSKGNLDIQLVVVTGRNKSLQKRLEADSSKFSFPMKVYGFTDKISDIMGASDLIITKAGPGTIREAVSKSLPIILTSFLPGQEKGNVDHVLKMQLGVVVTDYKGIVAAVRNIMQPETYSRHVSALQKENNPEAVYNIAKLILDYKDK